MQERCEIMVDTLEKKLVDDGLKQEQRDGLVELLTGILADEQTLYVKLRNYHWNVTGPNFIALHELLEDQYNEVAEFTDEVAEQIRQVGARAIGTMAEFRQHTRLEEQPGVWPNWDAMLGNLVEDYETLIRHLREGIDACSDKLHDEGTSDLLVGILRGHTKAAWMLRSHLESQNS